MMYTLASIQIHPMHTQICIRMRPMHTFVYNTISIYFGWTFGGCNEGKLTKCHFCGNGNNFSFTQLRDILTFRMLIDFYGRDIWSRAVRCFPGIVVLLWLTIGSNLCFGCIAPLLDVLFFIEFDLLDATGACKKDMLQFKQCRIPNWMVCIWSSISITFENILK